MLEIPYMEEWIEELGLNEFLKVKLFQALDSTDVGEVPFEDIVKALVRMRAPMQPAETVIWHLESAGLTTRLRQMQKVARENGIESWLRASIRNSDANPTNVTGQDLLAVASD